MATGIGAVIKPIKIIRRSNSWSLWVFRNTGKAIPREKMNIITDILAQYMLFGDARFEATTTLEYLNQSADCYGALVRYGDHVIFATKN